MAIAKIEREKIQKIRLGVLTLLMSCSILIPIFSFNLMFTREKILNFETLAKGSYGGYGKHDYLIIDSQIIWEEIWDTTFRFSSPQPLPEINFTINAIIAVFYGFHATGGFFIEITKISDKHYQYNVYVEETYPSPESMVTMATTMPYHIIKTIKLTKNVSFLTVNQPL
jgi:hypothetical protein